jgi:hypothetical protein
MLSKTSRGNENEKHVERHDDDEPKEDENCWVKIREKRQRGKLLHVVGTNPLPSINS